MRNQWRRKLAAVLAPPLLAGCLSSCAGMIRDGAWSLAQEAFGEGDYAEAIRWSNDSLRSGEPSAEDRADVYLLQARCHERLGEADLAAGLYSYVAEVYQDSPQGYQAREALAKLGRVPEAGVPPSDSTDTRKL